MRFSVLLTVLLTIGLLAVLPAMGELLTNSAAEAIVFNKTGIIAPFHMPAGEAVAIFNEWGIKTTLPTNTNESRGYFWDNQTSIVIEKGTTNATMFGQRVEVCAMSKQKGATIVPMSDVKSKLGKMAYAAIAMTKDGVRPGWYNPDTKIFTASSHKPTLNLISDWTHP
jgi:hypothetical protein